MDPVSRADRLVRLLRQRLEERARTAAAKPDRAAAIRPRSPDVVRSLAGQAARMGADDTQVGRLLVEQLLADQLGPNLVNDARFQQIVDEVTTTMMADEAAGRLIQEALSGLRAQGL